MVGKGDLVLLEQDSFGFRHVGLWYPRGKGKLKTQDTHNKFKVE